ncbi:phage tail protein [Cellulosimicrobium protaetiae]|uniref:Phage tail protein n=1 Tax=Cellulosimicrobium protaetiae TaxID=2587808 RepID=A0A6M5UCQ4_9MICO|nr:phage tail protein [Cellulosimicrobium protaetiae]QJW34868.1 phage tail protein [Cellulosimicrobium protaetiae]
MTGRGAVPGLTSPVPLASLLPGVLQDDELLGRFVAAFDDALAPVFLTLDGLDGYVDPWLAPRDHLDGVARWVGVDLDPEWPTARCRPVVAHAARTHRLRGTALGVAEAVRAVTGGEVEVADTGGVTASTVAGAELPGEPGPAFHVRVLVPSGTAVDERRVRDVVAHACPAHVPFTLEVVEDR